MRDDDPQAVDEDKPDGEASTFGHMLRAAREAQDQSLEQIAADLRIEPRYLISLEENRLEELPAPVFAKGYLKQYGQRLGLDYADLLAQYYRQTDAYEVPVVASRPIRLRDEQQITQWIIAAVVLALLIGAFFVWWPSRSEGPSVEVGTLGGEAPEGSATTTVVTPKVVATVEPVVLQATPTAVVTPEVVATVEPVVLQATPTAPIPLAQDLIPVVEPTAEVEIMFQADSWTEVTDARGERLFYDLGSAGTGARFSATLPLSVFLGNADGVRLLVDGIPYPVPASSRQGNTVRFLVDEAGP